MLHVVDELRITYGRDGAVLLDIRRGRVLRFNLTASLIFQHLQNQETIPEIVDAVSQRFHIAREVAQTDVADFVRSMEQEGLVQSINSEEGQ